MLMVTESSKFTGDVKSHLHIKSYIIVKCQGQVTQGSLTMKNVIKNSRISLKCKVIQKIKGHRTVKGTLTVKFVCWKIKGHPKIPKMEDQTNVKGHPKIKVHPEMSTFTQRVEYFPWGSKITERSKVIPKFKGLLLSAFLETQPGSEMGREWSEFGAYWPLNQCSVPGGCVHTDI